MIEEQKTLISRGELVSAGEGWRWGCGRFWQRYI